jgi:uncharacterized protein (DUF433 family)
MKDALSLNGRKPRLPTRRSRYYAVSLLCSSHQARQAMTTPRFEVNPKVMLGKPVIRGIRLPVELILRKLGEGATETDLFDAYPRLTNADIQGVMLPHTDQL